MPRPPLIGTHDANNAILSNIVFLDKRDTANAHLSHLHALTHKPMLQHTKEPNFCKRTRKDFENNKLYCMILY